MQKSFFSKSVKRFRETIKKGCAKLFSKVLRSFSYPISAIPSGITSLDHEIEVIYPERKLEVELPKSIQQILPCFSKEVIIPADGLLATQHATATALGGNLTIKGKLVSTFLQPLDGKKPHQHDLFQFSFKRFFPRIHKTDEPVITIAAGWQGSFYHWMYDVLPRLDLIEKKGISGKLYVESRTRFQKESLQILGLKDEQIINVKDFDAVFAGRLIVPSISALPTPWGCEFLRRRFLNGARRKEKKPIYISRQDAGWRRISNEDQVLEILKKFGFQKVVLSQLSFQEQIEVFYNAHAVVGPHGAGFAHLVFCDPKTPILELFSPSYVNPCYWQVSNRASLSYFYLLGKKAKDPGAKDPDIEVDLQELQKSLDLMNL